MFNLEKAKEVFYQRTVVEDREAWLEQIRTMIKEMDVKVPEVTYVDLSETAERFVFVCPDPEWEFPQVFIIRKDGYQKEQEYMSAIYDAICEYNKYSDFYDSVTEIGEGDLLAEAIVSNNIPVVQWYKSEDTEVLNVRKLNMDIN